MTDTAAHRGDAPDAKVSIRTALTLIHLYVAALMGWLGVKLLQAAADPRIFVPAWWLVVAALVSFALMLTAVMLAVDAAHGRRLFSAVSSQRGQLALGSFLAISVAVSVLAASVNMEAPTMVLIRWRTPAEVPILVRFSRDPAMEYPALCVEEALFGLRWDPQFERTVLSYKTRSAISDDLLVQFLAEVRADALELRMSDLVPVFELSDDVPMRDISSALRACKRAGFAGAELRHHDDGINEELSSGH